VFQDRSSPAEQGRVGLVDVQLALVGDRGLPRNQEKQKEKINENEMRRK
jgi:hypothetical protein